MCIFGKRLKKLRMDASLTTRELAEKLTELSKEDNRHISNAAISMYENGQRVPTLYMLNAIADFFGVDVNFLLGQDERSPMSDKHRKSALIIKKEAKKSSPKSTMSISIDKTLLESIKSIAKYQSVSTSKLVSSLIEQYVDDFFIDQDNQPMVDEGNP